jgi:hypothetical protein
MKETEVKPELEVSEAVKNTEEILQGSVEEQNATADMQEEANTEDANETSGTVVETEETSYSDASESLDDDALSEIDSMKKHDAAVLLVTKTRHIINDAEKQMDACRMLLKDDLNAYEEAKEALKSQALDESLVLLEELGYENDNETEEEESDVVFESKEDRPSFYVQDVSSGKFGSFILALIVGAGMLAGFAYFAASKAGITLDLSKVPSPDILKELAAWYGTLVVGKPDLMIGGGLVAVVTLLVMWIIYGTKVSGKAKRNLAFAKQQLEEAEEYAAYKGSCKEEMDKVDAHMNEAIKVLKTYEVVLTEQNGKLKRILHVEGIKELPSEYHEKSLKEMDDTHTLVSAIKNFIATPMSEEGKLSGKSTMFLHSAKSKLQKFLDRHY